MRKSIDFRFLVLLKLLAINALSQKFYLPPELSTIRLPEVADARGRIPPSLGFDYQPPPLGLQTPYPNDVYPMIKFKSTVEDHQGGDVALANEVTINEMSCQNSGDELYFRASLTPLKNFDQPVVVENAGNANCKLIRHRNEYRIEFGKNEFWNCGVTDCSTADTGKFYCLGLRFPAIPGLRMKDDFKVTLQCRAQEKIVSLTRRVNLKAIDTSARSAPRVAVGGHKNAFEVNVGLYRRTFGSEHVFNGKIEPGGTVVLGEEILLRAAVREGDGWKYSKMSDVTVHFVENRQRKRTMSSLWILDAEGCLNPQVRDICSGEQYRVSPLESYLLFKAFMFENMRETDEMVLSVKVTGCLVGEDCVLNCPAGHHVRKTRDVGDRNGTTTTTFDWQNELTFRVVESRADLEGRRKRIRGKEALLPFVFAFFALAIVAIVIYLVQRYTRMRRRPF